MGVRTVADLKNYLDETQLSPEALGKQVNISNMTLRRLLQKSSWTPIPSRYRLALDFHQASLHRIKTEEFFNAQDEQQIKPLLDQLDSRAEGCGNLETLKEDV